MSAVKLKMETWDPQAELNNEERRAVLALMTHPGFEHLVRLLMSEKQGEYHRLASLNVEQHARLLSVTQGKIEGLERVRQVMVELADIENPTDEEQ